MVSKFNNFVLVRMVVSALFVIQCSTSSPLEYEKLLEVTKQLDRLQTKMEALEAENRKLTRRIDDMQAENLESRYHSKLTTSTHAINGPSLKNNEPLTRAMSHPPSSCQELKDNNNLIPMDGLHLLKNSINNKIQVAFCTFPKDKPVSQSMIGNIDVRTKSVHFYAQRNTEFKGKGNEGIIQFEEAPLNEGGAMNLASGIFTAPVPGIYHFQFSGLKARSAPYLIVKLRLNGRSVGEAWTSLTSTNPVLGGTLDTVSMSASLRLKANDKVNLFNSGNNGIIFDSFDHSTHFTGWLVEQDLI